MAVEAGGYTRVGATVISDALGMNALGARNGSDARTGACAGRVLWSVIVLWEVGALLEMVVAACVGSTAVEA